MSDANGNVLISDEAQQKHLMAIWCDELLKVNEACDWKAGFRECLGAISQQKCGICKLHGHRDPQCWLSASVYDWCRKNGKHSINYSYRANIKVQRNLDKLAALHEYKKKAEIAQVESEVVFKAACASKRARR